MANPVTRLQLEIAGFEPTIYACRSCGHIGATHNLYNRCLAKGCECKSFTSMTQDERWAYAMERLHNVMWDMEDDHEEVQG